MRTPYHAGVSLQAGYTQLQQHSGSQEQELAALRTRSPAVAASSGPQSVDGGASLRLREMHGQLTQQDSQLASVRAENQVGDLALPTLGHASFMLVSAASALSCFSVA